MKSSVSIALFFLLSGFFLAVLLGALERSRKFLAVAAACLAAIVVIIVFLTPVELPSWHLGRHEVTEPTATSLTTTTATASTAAPVRVTSSLGGVTTTVGGSSVTY